MNQSLAQKQKQHILLAPQLQQSIKVLMLHYSDLKAAIEHELENNPCLEKIEADLTPHRKDKKDYIRRKNQDTQLSLVELHPAKQITLEEHLLRQARINFRSKKHLEIAELIICSLNDSGYLDMAISEIAQLTDSDIKAVDAVLVKIQKFDPVGCAARELRECLLIQLETKGKKNSLEYKILWSYFDDLVNKKCALLARRLKVDLLKVKLALKEISLLDPKPAHRFSYIDKSTYVIPDIVIDRDEKGEYKVFTNARGLPIIRVNQFYKNLLDNKDVSEAEKNFIRERLQSSQTFIHSVKMRQETVKKLVEYVIDVQKEFLDKGKKYLKPLSLKQAAEYIGRDESTVSRTVNRKYIDTPQGIFKLRALFSTAIKRKDTTDDTQGDLSSAAIKERIEILVEAEDKIKPLSDEAMLKYLHNENIQISRRTITKYRKQLKILPSHLRKE